MPEETSDLLAHSIDDAYTLLNFACRRAIPLDPAASKVIIDSHALRQAGNDLSSAEESAFWPAFVTVIDRVKPVTVESIVYTTVPENRTLGNKLWGRLSRGERALRRHLFLAILTLAALLALQVEWAIGTAIYNYSHKVYGQYQDAQVTRDAAISAAKAVKGTSAEPQANAALQKAEMRMTAETSRNNVAYVRIWWWNRQVSFFLPPYNLEAKEDGPATSAGEVALTDPGKRRIEFARAELILKIMSNYVLVTLFALLGAVTQALRTLSKKMANVALTSNDVFRGMTRIILGVISGVCMAWLYIITMDSSASANAPRDPLSVISFLGAFAPWALAFISGYSVEIFFTALERFIAIVIAKIKGATPLPGNASHGAAQTPTPTQPQPDPQASIK